MGFVKLPPLVEATWDDLRHRYPKARCIDCDRVWGLLVPQPDDDQSVRLFQPPKTWTTEGNDLEVTTSWESACIWVGDEAGRQAIQCKCGRRALLDRVRADEIHDDSKFF